MPRSSLFRGADLRTEGSRCRLGLPAPKSRLETSSRAEEMNGTNTRIELLVARWCEALFVILAAAGAPCIFRYSSEGVRFLGPYSLRYLIGVILPFTCTGLAGLLLLARPRWRGPAVHAPLVRRASGAFAWLAALGGIIYGLSVSNQAGGLLLTILLPSLVSILWMRVMSNIGPLVSAGLLMGLGLLLFGLELPWVILRPEPAVWGHRSVFAELFPRKPPFIGAGGRLIPNLDVAMVAPEYSEGARLVTNSAGFRNHEEFSEELQSGEIRVLSMGDSFSTGFCADQDHFFGSLLERYFNGHREGERVHVMNAEVSDPAYGLHYLLTHGLRYRPALVVYGLSPNDLMQSEEFYGADRLFRFDADRRLIPNPDYDPNVKDAINRWRDFVYPAEGERRLDLGPFGTLLPRLMQMRAFSWSTQRRARAGMRTVPMPSYLAVELERSDRRKRLIDGGPNLGLFYVRDQAPIEPMYRATFDLLDGMDRAARAAGARFALVVHAHRYQAQGGDWQELRRLWRLEEADFDLRLANRRIASYCDARGIPLCDLVEAFAGARPGVERYLPGGDTHYNRRGIRLAARAAGRCLLPMLP